MLLDIGGLDHAMQQVGIGIATQDSTGTSFDYRQTDTTIDLASTSDSNPFLTGVVFDDTTGNGEYQPGEELAGVTIAVSGAGSTTTLDAGGYSIQLAPGTYTVTASGGGLPAPIARTVVVGTDNVRLNFDEDPNGANAGRVGVGRGRRPARHVHRDRGGRHAGELQRRIDWGDGNASFATLTPNPDGTFSVAGSNDYAGPGLYSVRVLITHLSDGQTVALNATVAVDTSTYSGPTSPNPHIRGRGARPGDPEVLRDGEPRDRRRPRAAATVITRRSTPSPAPSQAGCTPGSSTRTRPGRSRARGSRLPANYHDDDPPRRPDRRQSVVVASTSRPASSSLPGFSSPRDTALTTDKSLARPVRGAIGVRCSGRHLEQGGDPEDARRRGWNMRAPRVAQGYRLCDGPWPR